MCKILYLALLVGVSNAVIISNNVVFSKVNEITTTRSEWVITFVIDMAPYEESLTSLTPFLTANANIVHI